MNIEQLLIVTCYLFTVRTFLITALKIFFSAPFIFFNQERATSRAIFTCWFIPRKKFALWIVATAIEGPSPLGSPLDYFPITTLLGTVYSYSEWSGILAFREIGTG